MRHPNPTSQASSLFQQVRATLRRWLQRWLGDFLAPTASEQFLNLFLTAPTPVLLFSPHHDFLAANPALYDTLNQPWPTAPLGLVDLLPEPLAAQFQSWLTTEETTFEFAHATPDQADRLMVARRYAWTHTAQPFQIVALQDVSVYKHREHKLLQEKDQAITELKQKSAFLADMSHEIRTPLTSIVGFASVLADEVTGQHREFAQLIERSGRQLLDTLHSVLDLARLQAGKVERKDEVLDVVQVVHEAVRLLRPLAQQKNLPIKVIAEEAELKVRTDRTALRRILNNLVSNAIKFTEHGMVAVEIIAEEATFRLTVRDTGVGILPDFLPDLFEEFKREPRSHDQPGSGLGLTITKRLVDLLEGKIFVQSEENKGSIFTVTLPRLGLAGADFAHPISQPPALLPHRAIHMLMMSERAETRLLVERMVQGQIACTTVATWQAIADLEASTSFDVVLMDVDGAQAPPPADLLARVQVLDGFRHVPIIALTAHALPGDENRFLAEGFSAYLAKPFTKQDVFHVLHHVLEPLQASSSLKHD